MTDLFVPLQSLKQGDWFKLICGASFQHLPAVRNLTLAYTLAGADCIDVAADPAVIAAAQAGLQVAKTLAKDAQKRGFDYKGNLPFLMVSLNDGEDPIFAKQNLILLSVLETALDPVNGFVRHKQSCLTISKKIFQEWYPKNVMAAVVASQFVLMV